MYYVSSQNYMERRNIVFMCVFSKYSCIGRGKELYYTGFNLKKSDRRWYQHDIDTIVYSEMFRKMQRKSQLFSMHDPISRSRLIHTFEVVRIAKEISEKLDLNTELTEGIALAHDFGNVAYGKAADSFLRSHSAGLFKHEEISGLMVAVAAARTVPEKYRKIAIEEIEKDSKIVHTISVPEYPFELTVFKYKRHIYYISVSPELLDGVIKHGTDGKNIYTIEGQVVNYADNIAYLIQDINDFEATHIFSTDDMENYSHILDDLVEQDSNRDFPIKDIVGKTTSTRTATLIERFISFNKKQIEQSTCPWVNSPILHMDIPILEIDPLLKLAIDRCWDFKQEYYNHELIKLSNFNAKEKIEQLWAILANDSLFSERNMQSKKFNDFLDSPIFQTYRQKKGIVDNDTWENWKRACFIAHLTCDDIDLIIQSYLSRDYIFDYSMPMLP